MSLQDDMARDHARYYARKEACDHLRREIDTFLTLVPTYPEGEQIVLRHVMDRLARESAHIVAVWD